MDMCFAPVASAVLWIYGKRLILGPDVESNRCEFIQQVTLICVLNRIYESRA